MTFPVSFLPHLTKRLILRRFVDADLDRFLSYRHDPQVARYQSWSMLSHNEAKSFIDEMHQIETVIPGEWFQIAISEKHSNLLVGDIGMQVYAEAPTTAEIGFTLSCQEQGKGYAQEAVYALIDLLFELEIVSRIVGVTDLRNERSCRLLTRLGMKLLKVEEVEFKGELCVEQTFELKKEDWLFYKTG